ncbi:polysaccharide pyruvyl transferase family protein [Xanthomarina gelatinilytica]|uniref:polysaccharide pyruvyl transferase family protein n=1 Tax=Xanthomarina gelatinilytica TaxID=1137281 RepID=UPI003AA8258A
MKKLNVYWYSMERPDNKNNYGDALAPFIVSNLSGKKVKRWIPKKYDFNFFTKRYFTIGSILKTVDKNAVVWGSGIKRRSVKVKQAQFCAVRGPLSRKRLKDLGYDVPEIYGDPALLLPDLIPNEESKRYDYGIIPHYVDYENVKLKFAHGKNYKIIDFITEDVVKTTKEILQCKQIISSSLHGVIVAHAYNIPALWVKFSDKVTGDNVKFYDYFESVGINYQKEFAFDVGKSSFSDLIELLNDNQDLLLANTTLLHLRKEQLLESCPFI